MLEARRAKRADQQKTRRLERIQETRARLGIEQGALEDISPLQLVAAVRGTAAVTARMMEIEVKGRQNKPDRVRSHLTRRGQMVAGVRKSLANIAAADFGKVLMMDVSKDTLLKAEVLLGAARVASCQAFHRQGERVAGEAGEAASGIALAVHSFSAELNVARLRV